MGELAKQLKQYLESNTSPLIRSLGEKMADAEDKKEEDVADKKNYIEISGVISKKDSDIRVISNQEISKFVNLQPWYLNKTY